ncbi:MAG: hypothetical protein E6K70_23865 [Planctomycetota bacterium]|nr:MAG: hypothetical protein E6K70_23865 [Planctomycetota bacterium]
MQTPQHPDSSDAQPHVLGRVMRDFAQHGKRSRAFRSQIEKHCQRPGAAAAVGFIAQHLCERFRGGCRVQFAQRLAG